MVARVKDQGSCGSCYIFAANAVSESAFRIFRDQYPTLSEQQVLDCCEYCGGCNGGAASTVVFYSQDHPLTEETKYPPYVGKVNQCDKEAEKTGKYIVDGFDVFEGNST